jgi:hypothetical protein
MLSQSSESVTLYSVSFLSLMVFVIFHQPPSSSLMFLLLFGEGYCWHCLLWFIWFTESFIFSISIWAFLSFLFFFFLIFSKPEFPGLKRWLSGQEHILLLQSTQVQFPLNLGSSQTPVTPAPGNPAPSSGLQRCHMHMKACMFINPHTNT